MAKTRLTPNLRSAFTSFSVEQYVYDLLPPRDAMVREIEGYAAKHGVPIIGPAVARVLALLVQVSGARRIFEMGSAIGYSTIWLARAAGPRAEVYYTDGDPQNAQRASEYFARTGVAKRIRVCTGMAQRILRETPGLFDLIFMDVDKEQYPEALRAALSKLKRGGLLVADNVLWSGRVARPVRRHDLATRGIMEFNRRVYASKQLEAVILPLRDGLLVARKR
jgi:predicted O-methyltransferase YrrM